MRVLVRTNNMIQLMGRVTKVNEFGKDVAAIVMALDNGRDKEGNDIKDTFVDVKCFEPNTYNRIKVGMLVMATCHFKNSTFVKDGQKVYALDVVADNIEFLESKAVVDAREAKKASETESETESTAE